MRRVDLHEQVAVRGVERVVEIEHPHLRRLEAAPRPGGLLDLFPSPLPNLFPGPNRHDG
jgi:hypothetical protein